MATQQIIRRGILQGFSNTTYTATVLILEATSYVLANVPIATSVDGSGALIGAACAVLFFDESNPADALVIAIYNAAPGNAPARVTFVPAFQPINAVTINSGTLQTFTLAGVGAIPTGALGVVFTAFFTCTLAGTSIFLAPHGGSIGSYAQIGNLPAANAVSRGNGLLPLDSGGRVDIQANNGNCVVTLFTCGYTL